jgi:hypothetical protein
MIEIKYKQNLEVADIAGQTVAETRAQYRKEFDLTGKTAAFLNGKKLNAAAESGIILNDDDKLQFKANSNHRVAFLVGALVLAMLITGSVFAYGFTNATVSLSATASSNNYADVSANTTDPVTWTARGLEKGKTGDGTLFDVNTITSGYTGDLSVSVVLGNADQLIKVYRMLTLVIEVRDSAGDLVDINLDGLTNDSDVTLLTMENGSVTFGIDQATADVYTIKVKSGAFICNLNAGWSAGDAAPMLYCEIAQR